MEGEEDEVVRFLREAVQHYKPARILRALSARYASAAESAEEEADADCWNVLSQALDDMADDYEQARSC